MDTSYPVVEYLRLGGRDARCDDTDDVRMFTTGTLLDVLSDLSKNSISINLTINLT